MMEDSRAMELIMEIAIIGDSYGELIETASVVQMLDAIDGAIKNEYDAYEMLPELRTFIAALWWQHRNYMKRSIEAQELFQP